MEVILFVVPLPSVLDLALLLSRRGKSSPISSGGWWSIPSTTTTSVSGTVSVVCRGFFGLRRRVSPDTVRRDPDRKVRVRSSQQGTGVRRESLGGEVTRSDPHSSTSRGTTPMVNVERDTWGRRTIGVPFRVPPLSCLHLPVFW